MELAQNGSRYQIMIEEPVSVLSILSVSAIITTISLFFCGIPICLEIWKRKSTAEITGFPFIMGFLGGSFWLRYGLLKLDLTMIIVNVVGASMMFLYILFYLYYTKSKTFLLFELVVVFGFICSMLVLCEIYGMRMVDWLGFVCMTFNILNFGAPLAGVTVVLRKKCCDSLPLPLITANLLVSTQWCLYGVLVRDIYIITPNGAGILLAFLQMSLFLFFPRNEGDKAPISRWRAWMNAQENADKPDLQLDIPDSYYGNATLGWNDGTDKEPNINSLDASGRSSNQLFDRCPSKAACIAYLRSDAFNSSGGSFYEFYRGAGGGSNPSPDTNTLTTTMMGSLSRVSSMSHPGLFFNESIDSSALPHIWTANASSSGSGSGGSCRSNRMFQNSFTGTFPATRYRTLRRTNGNEGAAGDERSRVPFQFDRIREVERRWEDAEDGALPQSMMQQRAGSVPALNFAI